MSSFNVTTTDTMDQLSSPALSAAKVGMEATSNIDNFTTTARVGKGESGAIMFWVAPVQAQAMTEEGGFSSFQSLRVKNLGYLPSKRGGQIGLSEELKDESREDMDRMATRLLSNAVGRLNQQEATDVLGNFPDTYGSYQNGLNYDDLATAMVHMKEIYNERWIFGPPDMDANASIFLSLGAIRELRVNSVGGTVGTTGALWGSEPLPAGPAAEVYRDMFKMSEMASGFNVYRAPHIKIFPVNSSGAEVDTLAAGSDGGMNGGGFLPDAVVHAIRNEIRTRRRTLDFNTMEVIQMWGYWSYNLGVTERGGTFKSKVPKPKTRITK